MDGVRTCGGREGINRRESTSNIQHSTLNFQGRERINIQLRRLHALGASHAASAALGFQRSTFKGREGKHPPRSAPPAAGDVGVGVPPPAP